jgi:hypothetical protein
MHFDRASADWPLTWKAASKGLYWAWSTFILSILSMVFVCGCSLLLAASADVRAAGRTALVMVAEDYQKLPKSSIGVKRGTEIAEALKARGFEVILSQNPNNATARASLRDFAAKADGSDLALAMLIGHGTAWSGQTFFLATNTEIDRASDLMSRALSTTSIAQIVGRARYGGVFFFMTIPSFGSTIEGLDARPQFAGEIAKNVFAVFSNSARVPVSRVDAAGEQAAEALARVLQQPSPALEDAVRAASNGNTGVVIGRAEEISLATPPPAPPAQPQPAVFTTPPPSASVENKAGIEAKLEAERQARELAESRARQEQIRAERAQAEVQKAQADAKKAQADAERAQADAERAKQEAKRVEAQAQIAAAQAEALKRSNAAEPIEDAQLGQKQRQMIQRRLKEMGLYTGPIDAIMGPLTREAIMGFQRGRGAAITGYLTAEQFDALLPDDKE